MMHTSLGEVMQRLCGAGRVLLEDRYQTHRGIGALTSQEENEPVSWHKRNSNSG